MKINIRDIKRLPNILTVIRILLIPIFIIAFLWENGDINPHIEIGDNANGYIIAAVIIIISGITDMADGFIARKFNMITDLGKVLDPFADKLTQAAVVVCLILRYKAIWLLLATLFAIIFVKEIMMLIMGLLFLKKGQDLGGAKWFGKLATIVFYILVIILIGAPVLNHAAAKVMICIMIACTILSFVLYMREYYRLRKQRQSEDNCKKGN